MSIELDEIGIHWGAITFPRLAGVAEEFAGQCGKSIHEYSSVSRVEAQGLFDVRVVELTFAKKQDLLELLCFALLVKI